MLDIDLTKKVIYNEDDTTRPLFRKGENEYISIYCETIDNCFYYEKAFNDIRKGFNIGNNTFMVIIAPKEEMYLYARNNIKFVESIYDGWYIRFYDTKEEMHMPVLELSNIERPIDIYKCENMIYYGYKTPYIYLFI